MLRADKNANILTVTGEVCSQLLWGAAPCRIQPLHGSVHGSLALVACFYPVVVLYGVCLMCCDTIGGELIIPLPKVRSMWKL